MDRFEFIRDWFMGYTESYFSDDSSFNEKIALKRDHSLRVVQNIVKLAESEELNVDEIELASCMALLHDVGRFEQLKKYNTFSDNKSEDHALMSINIINNESLLTDYSELEISYILEAVKFHNKFVVPTIDDKRSSLYIKLLRDADKLDIYKVVTEYYSRIKNSPDKVIELELPDKPLISRKIYEALMKGKAVNYKNLETLADFKLLQMAWVYDINFKKSFKIISEESYIKHIYDTMSKSDEVIDIYRKVKIFLENNL